MKGRTLTVRAIALFGAGSAAIHQLRYAIGYGNGADRALAAHPHGYLESLLPGIATAATIALAAVLVRVARGGSANGPARAGRIRSSLPALWLICALVLATIFGLQETLEGAGAFGGGGWIGIALALPVGFLVALALRGADAAAVRMTRTPPCVSIVATARLGVRYTAAPARLTDLRLGARAPPLASVV